MSKIVNPQESKKNIVIEGLDKCLKSLAGYDLYSLMPLLYVLYAHHEGYAVPIVVENTAFKKKWCIQPIETVNGEESPLLQEIRTHDSELFFSGQWAENVIKFYETYRDYINDFYPELIEHIIDFYTVQFGKFSGMAATPREVVKLMGSLISQQQPHGVYDPCAGLCSFAMLPELSNVQFRGSEINAMVKIIADMRMNAAGKKVVLKNESSALNWGADSDCDCLASELPFGISISNPLQNRNRPYLLEDYVIEQFIKSSNLQTAVLLVSASTCYRRANFDARKTLCDKNYIDAVIQLPKGVLPYTGLDSVILVLNKNRITQDITFVYADDCLVSDKTHRTLDYQMVIDRLQNTDNEQTSSVNVKETFSHNCELTPAQYITKMIEVAPGQKLVKVLELAKIIRGEGRFTDKTGRVLQQEDLCEKVTDIHTKDLTFEPINLGKAYSTFRKVVEKCVIFNVQANKFYYKNDNQPLFVSPNYTCFVVNEEKCLPEYFIHLIIDNPQIVSRFMRGPGMQRVDYNSMQLPFYENLESQKNIIQRIFRQESSELKKKRDKLQILSGRSSDLIHNLGITFTKIGAGIASLKNEVGNNKSNNPLDSTIEALNDNVQFALRQINSTGTDYKYVTPNMEKVVLQDVVQDYIRAWKNFGFQTFEVAPLKPFIAADTKVEMELSLFHTMLDCIFINAHQHAFSKCYTDGNRVIIELHGVLIKDEKFVMISVANNGKPLPDGYTLNDFVERGNVGINSSQDGLGGDHILKIVHHFGGYVSISNDSNWLSFNILLPIYLTSNETEFIDYDNKYI